MFHPPAIRNILVPTDFSSDSDVALAHALRLTLAFKGELDLLHVEPDNDTTDWTWAPHIVETLCRWGYLDRAAAPHDLASLGIRARQTLTTGVAPAQAILEEIAASHADLVVLATHGRAGLERLLQPSVTNAVLRRRPVPILLLPAGCRGFVDVQTGELTMSRVLVPIAATPNPAPAFDAAVQILRALQDGEAQIATLHVGAGHPEAELMRPDPGWRVFHWNATGGVVDNIVDVATTWTASMVVAVSEGRRNYLDELRGSTVERLVERSKTPVLIVPADWGSTDVS